MIGVGEIVHAARNACRLPRRLARAGMRRSCLGAKEGLALLNGTQFSTAYALAGLFEAETLLQAGLITGALSIDAARGSDAPFDARIHALRRPSRTDRRGRALRTLIAGSAIRASHLYRRRSRAGPVLPALPAAGDGRCAGYPSPGGCDVADRGERRIRQSADLRGDPPEALSGGNFHGEPVAFAADIIALALCEIGAIAERRIAMLIDPALSRLPAFLTPKPGLNSGFMMPQVTAAALVAENRQRATPASVDSIPTSANQEDHVSMAAHARAPAAADGGQRRRGHRHRIAGRGAGLRLPRAAAIERAAGSGARPGAQPRFRIWTRIAIWRPDIAKAIALVRSGRRGRRGRAGRPARRRSAKPWRLA